MAFSILARNRKGLPSVFCSLAFGSQRKFGGVFPLIEMSPDFFKYFIELSYLRISDSQ